MNIQAVQRDTVRKDTNKLLFEDQAVHDWYRFVLSFPPHLVRTYLQRFQINNRYCILDPFCGTGTVLVECKKHNVSSIGIDANPMAYLASRIKTDWTPHPNELIAHARAIAAIATQQLNSEGIEDESFFCNREPSQRELRSLPEASHKLLLTNSISPLPLHKTLVLLECIEQNRDERYYHHERLALAKSLLYSISNLRFGPEVGIGAVKHDTSILSPWLDAICLMSEDLHQVRRMDETPTNIFVAMLET